ncbi:MAG: hypothetical protein AB7T07_11120 [Steroidobacteraceae bacterium]
MKKTQMTLGSILLCMASHMAFADCTYPKAPDAVPDAKSASQAEMLAAMSEFKQYNSDVDAYVTCLDEETTAKVKDAGAAGAIMQIKAMQAKKKSAATDERQAKIEAFNKAVREFKSKG